MMKRIIIVFGVILACECCTFAEPTVTDVVAKQRYPWNGLVDITCKVSGISGTEEWEFALAAVMPDSGEVRKASRFWLMQGGTKTNDLEVHTNGIYRLLWDARADLGQVLYSDMVVRVTTVKWHGKVQLWEDGPYWATTNIGAEEPWEYGYRFWWGDTVGYTRSGGTWTDYGLGDGQGYYDGVTWVSSTGQQMSSSPFSSSSCPTYGKDNSALLSTGYIDSTGNLTPAHDAAQVQWGGRWRMPTDAEFLELIDNCTTTWITTNGVSGRLVTGKGDYANRSIFLPAAGNGLGSCLNNTVFYGYYWSSTPNSGYSGYAWILGFYSSDFHRNGYSSRYDGLPVRPVRGFAQ